ncbi:hypothetical protein EVAR_43001_1 [Eumeta japonica]|uniref:Uncharacterized protein n=1 Tax=Eumeta variegata TaxID=151549 RepID=A0A4C1WB45_EUMVA|nr:hypothetical protein EVAR_43001_1 [Eumeta japonica]
MRTRLYRRRSQLTGKERRFGIQRYQARSRLPASRPRSLQVESRASGVKGRINRRHSYDAPSQDLSNEFKRGHTNLPDDLREARSSTTMTEDNINAMRLMIETDKKVTFQQIRPSLGIVLELELFRNITSFRSKCRNGPRLWVKSPAACGGPVSARYNSKRILSIVVELCIYRLKVTTSLRCSDTDVLLADFDEVKPKCRPKLR